MLQYLWLISVLTIAVTGKPEIDVIYYLQRFKEGWKDGKWEEKFEFRDCNDDTGFTKVAYHWCQIPFCHLVIAVGLSVSVRHCLSVTVMISL